MAIARQRPEAIRRRGLFKVETPAVADEEFAVAHRLGRKPVGIVTLSVDKDATLTFSDMREATADYAYLKCSAASVKAVISFV